MANVETIIRSQADGLVAGWQSYFGANGISIKGTDRANSDKAVADTVALMGSHARDASSSQQIKDALAEAGCLRGKLTEDEVIDRVFNFIKRKVRFVEDDSQLAKIFAHSQTSQELLITPPVLLSMPSPMGDCDDFSMLVCSMLMAKGIQCDFVTVAANSNQPNEFSHVYCLARTRDGRLIPIDASHGTRAGWETNRQFRKQVWPVFNWGAGTNRLGGLGMIHGNDSKMNRFQRAILNGLGDDSIDLNTLQDYSPTANDVNLVTYNPPVTVASNVASPSNPSSNILANLLPGIFGSAEKIAVQTTQQPGYQITSPNGTTTSYVLPSGSNSIPNLNIPGLTSTSLGSFLPLLLIGGVLLFFAKE